MGVISDKLKKYSESSMYPFHMPGHKRMIDGSDYDITEIEGFDNLNNPKGILKEFNENIAKVYLSNESYFTVNGSTCGNFAAVFASTKEGDSILIARNCHKSIYNAIKLRCLNVSYIYPKEEGVLPGRIELDEVVKQVEKLEKKGKKPKALVITSPTYEGFVSDVAQIGEYLHSKGIVFIVDSAHGAHFPFHEGFLNLSLENVDVCITSFHKTLPVFNQAAAVHVNSKLVSTKRVEEYLHIFQTSSPSYMIIASAERGIEIMSEKDRVEDYYTNLINLYNELEGLMALSIERRGYLEGRDISKVVIYTNGYISGFEIQEILRNKYNIELELAEEEYILAMTSVMDTKNGFEMLIKALKEIDNKLYIEKVDICERKECSSDILNEIKIKPHEKVLEIYEIEDVIDTSKFESNYYGECEGEVSLNTIIVYPPGIPLIVAGERITKEDIEYIRNNITKEGKIVGIDDQCINVFKEYK